MTKEASLIKNTNGFCLLKAHQCSNWQRIHQNDGFLSVEMSWPLFFICKLQKKLFLHTQCPILFGVEFWKQQISSNDIRSSYFCVPLWEIYSMNIFRLFLQRKGKKVMFFSVQTDTVWLKLSSVSRVAKLQHISPLELPLGLSWWDILQVLLALIWKRSLLWAV